MRKQWILAALLSVILGNTLAFAKTASNTAPLLASDPSLKTCSLHGIPLQLGTAAILYGRRSRIVDPAASKRAFPTANSHVFGGCIVPRDSPGLQAVKFCPKCRAAEQRWLAAHHRSIPKH